MQRYNRTALVALTCLYFVYAALTFTSWHYIDSVDLVFHEAGHTIFFFLGELVQVLAGSAFQVLVPLLIAVYFFLKWERLSASLVLLWVGQSILNVAVYAGDAAAMQLPLLGGDNVMHDWNYLLKTTHLLQHTEIIAGTLHLLGILIIFVAIPLSLYFAWKESKTEEERIIA